MGIPRTTIIAALAFSIGICSIVLGQDDEPWRPKPRAQPKLPATPKKTLPKKVIVTPTTGSLSVGGEPGATILVERLDPKKSQKQQGIMPKGETVFIFNNLQPGRYRVSGTLAGYECEEREVIVQANRKYPLTLNFQAIRYPVTISTNIDAGELKYGLGGQPLYSVAINNKRVQLNLAAGIYEIELTAREYGYEKHRGTLKVDGELTYDINLNRIFISTATLSPSWTSTELKGWDMPSSWQADSNKRLILKGKGIALPREQGFRYYKDFRLESSVQLNNKSAVSFVLRARDQRNYYLLQLTSENSDEPHRLRLFVVKDGVERRIQAIPIPQSRNLGSGFFSVSIRMIDYQITVELRDSQTGASYPLGGLTDPDHNFGVGAVGMAVHDNEENLIGSFLVCTGPRCMDD